MILNTIILIGIGFWIGVLYNKLSISISEKLENLKRIKNVNEQYEIVLNRISEKKSKFKNRVNNTVYLSTDLPDYGKVEVLYLLDKQDIVLFQEEKCIFLSKEVKKETLDGIIKSIHERHGHRIEDVVEVFGMVFYRKKFERVFGINIEEIKKQQEKLKNFFGQDQSDIQQIISKNEQKFDVDDLLDKISKVGFDNLTPEEKEFLNNFGK